MCDPTINKKARDWEIGACNYSQLFSDIKHLLNEKADLLDYQHNFA